MRAANQMADVARERPKWTLMPGMRITFAVVVRDGVLARSGWPTSFPAGSENTPLVIRYGVAAFLSAKRFYSKCFLDNRFDLASSVPRAGRRWGRRPRGGTAWRNWRYRAAWRRSQA